MMGKTLILKLPNGGYMSIGKADKERFLKAKEQEDAPAPAKKPVKAKVKAGSRSSAMKPALKQKPAGRAKVASRIVKKVRR